MSNKTKGICRLNCIPVRKEPTDATSMVTQLLFGEHYTVLEENENGWIKISIHFDGYEGWIKQSQHHPITEEYFDQINHSDYKICTEVVTTILYHKSKINILMGSIIPISTNELFKMEEKLAFNGDAKPLSVKRDFEFLKGIAQKLLNTPYLYGGRTPFGIDSSGFVQLVFRICGYKLSRDCIMQSQQGEPISEIGDYKPGDLIFFKGNGEKKKHVGILFENNKVIHCDGKVKIDILEDHNLINSETGVATFKFCEIRRILNE
ncbi:MAG: C40 family peptidase [Cyclobacteriaceae bacterium]|nr:C40 family peptidase [Cyclobacteriaceae bacterium]